jgi:hypothetical protein
MNDYYHKYIKYKSKYINLIYGGIGTPTKEIPTIDRPSWAEVVKSKSTSPVQQPPSTPQQPPSTPQQPPSTPQQPPSTPQQPPSKQQQPPSTPQQPPSNSSLSTKPPPVTPTTALYVGTPGSGFTPGPAEALPSTPKLEIDQQTVEIIIRSKDELIKLLISCGSLSNYDITERTSRNRDLYINFQKKGEHTYFAHFSFHNPTDPPSTLKLNDMFDINGFHLRYDNNSDIFFNLRKYDDERLILQSPMNEEVIIALIGCENYYELIKIKNCLEEKLNTPEIKKYITDPVAKKLNF